MSWALEGKRHSQRHACGLVGMAPRVYRYQSGRPDARQVIEGWRIDYNLQRPHTSLDGG